MAGVTLRGDCPSNKQHNEKSRWFESREVKDSTNAILVKASIL